MKNLAVISTNINQRLTIMEWLSIQLIMSFFSFIFVTESDALSYYVIPNEKSGYSDGWSTCFTLQKYASQPDEYFTDHTIFYFESGSHQLNSSLYLVDMSNLTFQGLPNSELVNVLLGSFVNITWEIVQILKFYSLTSYCKITTHSVLYLSTHKWFICSIFL